MGVTHPLGVHKSLIPQAQLLPAVNPEVLAYFQMRSKTLGEGQINHEAPPRSL